MAIDNLQHRIGEKHTTGNLKGAIKKRPVYDVNGHDYAHIGTLAQLDSARFVVLPVGFRNWQLIADIKQELGIGVSQKRKAEVEDSNDE